MNRNDAVVADFGDEWSRFTQEALSRSERDRLAALYFAHVPWEDLPSGSSAVDVGCGSGRWADYVAPRVGRLTCIDASEQAVEVARRALAHHANAEVLMGSVHAMPLPAASADLVYSLGVLHHVPDTQAAIDDCVALLAPGGILCLYLYYSFENRPAWFRVLWRMSDVARRLVSALPRPMKSVVCEAIAIGVYWPLARATRGLELLGLRVDSLPLAPYRRLSMYWMRTDARDRFGTRLEQRFSRAQVIDMLTRAGLVDVDVPPTFPYWIGVGRKPWAGEGTLR